MTEVWLNGFRPAADCASRELVEALAPTAYKWPIKAFPEQDLRRIVARVTSVLDLPAVGGDVVMRTPSRLDMFTIHNGFFAIGPGRDGMVFTPAGEGVREACMFSEVARESALPQRVGEASDTVLDEVFVGCDAAAPNWFHWICFALAKSAIAADLLSPECRIVLPNWINQAAWQQSLVRFGLAERVTLLPPGIWRARKIRLLWTDSWRASDIIPFDCFADVFHRLQMRLHLDPAAAKRILVARDRSPDPRLNSAEQAMLHDVAATHGFQPMRFEKMDFAAQTAAMFNAELVLGVHGAGLANILFGREQLGVLEVNRNLDGPGGSPRPWFYMVANSRRQRYMTLDRDTGELTRPRLDAAIEALAALP